MKHLENIHKTPIETWCGKSIKKNMQVVGSLLALIIYNEKELCKRCVKNYRNFWKV